jgi:rod shape-determining protein MreC
MRLNEYKKRKKIMTGIFVLIAVIFIFRFTLNNMTTLLNGVLLPVKILAYKVSRNSKETFDNLKDIEGILNENKGLKEENYALKLENFKLHNMKEENKRLKTLLEMKQEDDIDFQIANISFRDPLSVYDEFFINKGKKDGVKEDMIVLNKSALLGKVKKVYETNAVVELITKNSIYTSILVGEGNHLGVLKGVNSEELAVEYITNDIGVKVGDRVITSGVSDVYPKGLFLGEIISVKNDEDYLYKEVKMKLPYNIFEIYEVVILK